MGNIYRLLKVYAVHQIQERKSPNIKWDIGHASKLQTQGIKMILCKVPAHIEIKENEYLVKVAK